MSLATLKLVEPNEETMNANALTAASIAAAPAAAFDADATLDAPRSSSPVGVWVPVERLLVEACRRRAASLVGVEVSIDCEAPGLRALDDDLGKLTRSVDLLFEAALGRSKPAELHVAEARAPRACLDLSDAQ